MVIKVVKNGNKTIVKGIPKRAKEAILVGILILVFLSIFGLGSPKPFNVLIIAIFGMIIIIGGLIHAIKERKKALREYNEKEVQ